jgi:3-methylcrotonyl-CoA carboxylase alpha subunit
MAAPRLTLRLGEREFKVAGDRGGYVTVDDVHVAVRALSDGTVWVDDGTGRRGWAVAAGDVRWVFLDGRVFQFDVQRQGARQTRGPLHHGALAAPMPATVRRIGVKAGDAVKKGQTLVLLEAMKMELPVRSASDGTVTSVNCTEGELVQPGTTLVELDELE